MKTSKKTALFNDDIHLPNTPQNKSKNSTSRVIDTIPKEAIKKTKAQGTFHRLIKEIEIRRGKLKEWQVFLPAYESRARVKMQPLMAEFQESRAALAFYFDDVLTQKNAVKNKKYRALLEEWIVDITSGLLTEKDPADAPEWVLLHDQYAEMSFAELEKTSMDMAKKMAEKMFGTDLGDLLDERDPEIFAQKMAQKIQEDEQKGFEGFEGVEHFRKMHEPKPRKKSAKALAAEEKEAQAAKEISQSVREVYRKLASALHPDRETNEAEKTRKNALMQRVNQAYDAGDLLALLDLQLEIEQIDATHLADLSEARQAHYNAVLKEQLEELKDEEFLLLERYLQRTNATYVTPAILEKMLENDARQIKKKCAAVAEDFRCFQNIEYLKVALQHESRERGRQAKFAAEEDDFPPEMAEFEAMFGEMFASLNTSDEKAAPSKKRRK